MIYPEGGTTNGSSIIQFQKGAFASLLSIKPTVHKWDCKFQSACSGVVDGSCHYIMICAMPWCSVTRVELPVFRPNEYFWKNHMKEGEEKADTYTRVIR